MTKKEQMAQAAMSRKSLNKIANTSPQQIITQETTTPPTPAAQPPEPDSTEGKRKPGRPKVKTEDTRTINIAVPVSMLDKIEIAKAKYHGNLTEYINAIIAADMDAHYTEYLTIYNLIND